MTGLIIVFLWMIISGLILFQNIEACADLSDKERFIVVIIFLLGGPFLAAGAIFEYLLDSFLPDGWNGDDDDDFKKY